MTTTDLYTHRLVRGFTILELLVVIAIISIIISITLAALGQARENARESNRAAQTQEILKALELYYSVNGTYPSSPSGTMVNLNHSSVSSFLVPDYITEMPTDPKYDYQDNTSYRYCSSASSGVARSYVVLVNLESDDNDSEHCYITRGGNLGSCADDITALDACLMGS